MANLLKELENSIEKRKKSIEKSTVLEEVKGLLEYDTQKDLHILRTLGSNSSLAQSEEEKHKLLEIERKENYLSGKVFTREQIVNLGVRYRLKFLHSTLYTGYIDPSVVLEIKEMGRVIAKKRIEERAVRENCTVAEYMEKYPSVDKNGIDDDDLKRRFFILAPAKLFKTEKSSTFHSIPATDPIMFYTDDNHHFRLIKKWGSDFTIARRVLGWMTKSLVRHVFALYLLPLILLIAFLAIKYHAEFLYLYIPLGIATCIFAAKTEADKNFGGENYVTSTKRFYM